MKLFHWCDCFALEKLEDEGVCIAIKQQSKVCFYLVVMHLLPRQKQSSRQRGVYTDMTQLKGVYFFRFLDLKKKLGT